MEIEKFIEETDITNSKDGLYQILKKAKKVEIKASFGNSTRCGKFTDFSYDENTNMYIFYAEHKIISLSIHCSSLKSKEFCIYNDNTMCDLFVGVDSNWLSRIYFRLYFEPVGKTDKLGENHEQSK